MTQNGPVTIVVRHLVKPDKEPEFRSWGEKIRSAALRFKGHGGFHVTRQNVAGGIEYTALFAFDTSENLLAWQESSVHQELARELSDLVVEPVTREEHTGMEAWFIPPPRGGPAKRYKMVLVTFLGIYPLVLILLQIINPYVINPLLADWPFPLRTMVGTAFLVCVMTYLAMPLLTKLFKNWLFGPR